MPSARIWLLLGVSLLTFFVGLGHHTIADSDEAFYAQAALEMVTTGDWITPYYNGVFRFEKPVLFYWLVAAAYLVAGVTEFGARTPSALAGLILVLVTYRCGQRWCDTRTAQLAGMMVATSFGYIAVARQALPDLVLAAFVTIAIWAATEALVRPRTVPQSTPMGWLTLAGAAMACGVLTKGPIGVVLPAIVVAPLAAWRCLSDIQSGSARTRSVLLQLVGDLFRLAVVCLVLTVPWFAVMTLVHGVAYLDRFFITENVARFVTDRYNEPRPFWYYLPIVAGGLMPWSALMILWWRPFRRILIRVRRVEPVEVWLMLWVLLPLAFYSVSIGKQPRYILPVLPPLAILLARSCAGAIARVRPSHRDRLMASAGLLSGIVLVVFGGLLGRAGPLLVGVSTATLVAAALAIAVTGLGVSIVALSSHQRQLPAALVVAAVVTTLSVQHTVLSRPGPDPVESIAALVRADPDDDVPYGRYRVFVRNLVFYTGRPHVELASPEQVLQFLASPDRVLCVLAQPDLEHARDNGAIAHEVGRVTYLNTGNLTLRTLLWPNPALDLQTVVLVTNRVPG